MNQFQSVDAKIKAVDDKLNTEFKNMSVKEKHESTIYQIYLNENALLLRLKNLLGERELMDLGGN